MAESVTAGFLCSRSERTDEDVFWLGTPMLPVDMIVRFFFLLLCFVPFFFAAASFHRTPGTIFFVYCDVCVKSVFVCFCPSSENVVLL